MPGTSWFGSSRIGILALYGLAIFSALETRANAKHMPVKPIWNDTWTDHLKRDLLLNYDKYVRPAQHFNTTAVSIGITVKHVVIEELKSLMTVHAWVAISWMDGKLKWNASNYGNLTMLHLGDHEVWQPDIVLYNSAAGSTVDHYGNTHCLAGWDGIVLWVPPSQFVVFCELDLRFWPYDTQVCTLKLGSWSFNGEDIDLQFSKDKDRIDLMIENTEWMLKELTRERNVIVDYPCCSGAHMHVTYNLTLKRKSSNYVAIVMTPATAIVFLTLVTFWLPPQSEGKITVAACTAMLISLFLIYFSQKLPQLAYNTPLIVHFYSCSLYLVSISLIISVSVINMSKRTNTRPLPWRVKQVLAGRLGKVLWLDDVVQLVEARRANTGEEMRESNAVDGNQSVSGSLNNSNFDADDPQNILIQLKLSQMEWTLAATAIDRIAFLFYCFVFIILVVRCSV